MPTNEVMIAVITGASTYPRSPNFGGSEAFLHSAEGVRQYLSELEPSGVSEDDLLWLFDDWRSPPYQIEQMSSFIRTRTEVANSRGATSINLVFYHVGHGFFARGDQSFCLATRYTSDTNQAATSIRLSDFARALRESANSVRKYIILDCCFAANAVPVIQASIADVVTMQGLGSLASSGTAVLCSSSPGSFSLAPTNIRETMFCGSLLRVLRRGDPALGEFLSFRDLEDLISNDLRLRHPEDWVRPELHVPEKGAGDIARVEVFPNAAKRNNNSVVHNDVLTCIVHPYPIQNNFTGRHSERRLLSDWWVNNSEQMISLVAMGGMGKSSVAWVWAQRDLLGNPIPGMRDDDERSRVPAMERPDGVFWWSFYEGDAEFNNFVQRALAFISKGTAERGLGHHGDMQRLLDLLKSNRYLFVLDGFERELTAFSELGAAYEQDEETEEPSGSDCANPVTRAFLRAFVSLTMSSRIVMTTRVFPKELQQTAGCRHTVLKELDIADGITFLKAQGVTGSFRELEEACRICGSHPLALRLLAGVVVSNPALPGNVRPVLEMKQLNADLDVVARKRHVLDLAYSSLSPSNQRLLSQIAAFRFPVSYEVLKATLGEREHTRGSGFTQWIRQFVHTEAFFHKQRDLERGLRQLAERGLLFFDRGRRKYDLHPIVRSFAYDRLADKAGVHTQFRNYFNLVPLQALSTGKLEELEPLIELYHHTVRAEQYSEAFKLFRDRLQEPLLRAKCDLVTYTLLIRALISEDDDDCSTVLHDTEDEFLVLTCLGHSYYLRGVPGRAISIYQKCIKSQGADPRLRRKLSPSLVTLALAEISAGDLESAELHLNQAISSGTKGQGTDFALLSREILSELYLTSGRLEDFNILFAHLETSQHGVHYYRAQCIYHCFAKEYSQALVAAQAAYQLATNQSHFEGLRARLFLCKFLVECEEGISHPTVENFDVSEVLSESIDAARRGGLGEMEIDGTLSLANWRLSAGDLVGAKELIDEALPVIEQAGLLLLQARAELLLGLIQLNTSKSDGILHLSRAKQIAQREGRKFGLAVLLSQINTAQCLKPRN
jgi:hypothetical protein